MSDQEDVSRKGKWSGRLALLFLFLFAILWSLGPFFFWILLALSAYFVVLFLISSEDVSTLLSSLTPSQSETANRSVRTQPVVPKIETNPAPLAVQKFSRIVFIFSAGLLLFFFLIARFVGNDGDGIDTEGIESEIINSVQGVDWWNNRGNMAMDETNYDSAIFYYDRALAIDDQHQYALYNKGLAYTLQQDYHKSNSLARRCLRYHNDYYPAWWLLGYNYDLLNNIDSAFYFLEKAYVDDFVEPDFLQLMAEVYIKKNDKSSALQVYQKLTALDTTRPDVFRKMAELDPSHGELYRNKANQLEQSVK